MFQKKVDKRSIRQWNTDCETCGKYEK